jgi:selenide,water dikinase
MGGTPVSALNVLCYPVAKLGPEILHAILAGAARKLAEAEVSCLGGHSVVDPELKFGCAVTGRVHPERIWRNLGARVGDALVLTKPLGTGVLGTALKRGKLSTDQAQVFSAVLLQLNRTAATVGQRFEIHAATDVTGFGLGGHGGGLAHASGVTVEIETGALPLLPGVVPLIQEGNLTRGDRDNRNMFDGRFQISDSVSRELASVVFDPQTSGGLLFALPTDVAADLVAALREAGCPQAARVGRIVERDPAAVMRLV